MHFLYSCSDKNFKVFLWPYFCSQGFWNSFKVRSTHFHIVAWGVPAFLVISTLVSNSVFAEPLTGMCRTKYGSLLFIIPESIIIFVTIFMIITSLFSMWRIKKNLKVAPVRSDRLDILVQKIMKFSLIYLLPKSKYSIRYK